MRVKTRIFKHLPTRCRKAERPERSNHFAHFAALLLFAGSMAGTPGAAAQSAPLPQLFADNFLADNRTSIDRLANFAATHPIRAALGAHIEMTRAPGRDYPHEAATHPDEHRLELPAESIGELQAGLQAKLDVPDQPQVHDHFIIYPVAARTE